jgi:Fic family protein
MNERAGRFVTQEGGYRAFVPASLPPVPPVEYDDEARMLVSEADRALARLDGISFVLPNPDLFVEMYLWREALLSSQIEGTQSSLEEVLEFSAGISKKADNEQERVVSNYVKATHQALAALSAHGLTLDIIKAVHGALMEKMRGGNLSPGEFRRTQNYVGRPGLALADAAFVPPPPGAVPAAMQELLDFINQQGSVPPLVKAALIHAQFETIHPFRDGNGRIGRMLITLYLCMRGILDRPLLCMSYFLKKQQTEYYDRLMQVRLNGDWEQWVKFFLRVVAETSKESAATAGDIIRLKERLLQQLVQLRIATASAVGLLERLFREPYVGVPEVVREFGVSRVTASQLLGRFEQAGILREVTGTQKRRRFVLQEYVAILSRGTEG